MQTDTKGNLSPKKSLKCFILGHKWEKLRGKYVSSYAKRCERCRKIDIRIEGL